MANIKQFVTPDNLGPDFEQDATAKYIKVNIDGVTIIRDDEGKLVAVGDGEDLGFYNITELPEGAKAPTTFRGGDLAAGVGARAAGSGSIAVGSNAIASGTSCIAVGSNASAVRPRCVVLGADARASKADQVSIARLDAVSHLATEPRLLSGVKTPEVGQDAANKDYVDNYIKTKLQAANITTSSSVEDLIKVLLN